MFDRLQETIGDAQAGGKNRDEAVRQLDAILQEMRKALGKMTRLEDLNEVIETLRAIIRDEEKVEAFTQKAAQGKPERLEGEDAMTSRELQIETQDAN